jgi:hypothetical protein
MKGPQTQDLVPVYEIGTDNPGRAAGLAPAGQSGLSA